MTAACTLCGFAYEPGDGACRERGCPLAFGCRVRHCPRCGYAEPDETTSLAARFVRWLFRPKPGRVGRTLADLASGEVGTVSGFSGAPSLLARLTAQGLTPGLAVRVRQRWPAFVVEAGETTLAFDRRVAEAITIAAGPVGPGYFFPDPWIDQR